ncbi:MAG: hypothetical protein VX910_11585 [Candidatus Latescibacterota bacterium]|nr:hypothetical protein [Candidatus Latescibacterota bacterium]
MANQRRRDRQRSRSGRGKELALQYTLPYEKRNGIVFVVAIALILIGYICMSQPPVDGFLSLTLAPILLVIGYVFLIPAALLMKTQKEMEEDTEAERGQATNAIAK